jgi:hypothetical protein
MVGVPFRGRVRWFLRLCGPLRTFACCRVFPFVSRGLTPEVPRGAHDAEDEEGRDADPEEVVERRRRTFVGAHDSDIGPLLGERAS